MEKEIMDMGRDNAEGETGQKFEGLSSSELDADGFMTVSWMMPGKTEGTEGRIEVKIDPKTYEVQGRKWFEISAEGEKIIRYDSKDMLKLTDEERAKIEEEFQRRKETIN